MICCVVSLQSVFADSFDDQKSRRKGTVRLACTFFLEKAGGFIARLTRFERHRDHEEAHHDRFQGGIGERRSEVSNDLATIKPGQIVSPGDLGSMFGLSDNDSLQMFDALTNANSTDSEGLRSDDQKYMDGIKPSIMNQLIAQGNLYELHGVLASVDVMLELKDVDFFRLAISGIRWDLYIHIIRENPGDALQSAIQRSSVVDIRKVLERAVLFDYERIVRESPTDGWFARQKKKAMRAFYEKELTKIKKNLEELERLDDELQLASFLIRAAPRQLRGE